MVRLYAMAVFNFGSPCHQELKSFANEDGTAVGCTSGPIRSHRRHSGSLIFTDLLHYVPTSLYTTEVDFNLS